MSEKYNFHGYPTGGAIVVFVGVLIELLHKYPQAIWAPVSDSFHQKFPLLANRKYRLTYADAAEMLEFLDAEFEKMHGLSKGASKFKEDSAEKADDDGSRSS